MRSAHSLKEIHSTFLWSCFLVVCSFLRRCGHGNPPHGCADQNIFDNGPKALPGKVLISTWNKKADSTKSWTCGPLMGNLSYNRWRWEWSDQNTSWRHLSSVDVAPQKRSCTFFYRIYPNENIVYSGVLPIFHPKNRCGIENFAFDAYDMSFDKFLPKQVGYFGTRINWKQP
jgi:hypothetical protein